MTYWKRTILRASVQALGLLILTALLACVSDLVRPYFGGQSLLIAETKTEQGMGEHIFSIQDVQKLLENKKGILVDARSPEEFAQGHIPTAINVPHDTIYGDFESAVAHLPKSDLIIVYCSDAACSKSQEVAEGLKFLQFPNVGVMPDGMMGWIDSGAEVEVTQ